MPGGVGDSGTATDAAPRVALCVGRYAPAAPTYRSLAALARVCAERGLAVSVYALDWTGEVPAGVVLKRRRAFGFSATARTARYWRGLPQALAEDGIDCAVGFEDQEWCHIRVQSCRADGRQQMTVGALAVGCREEIVNLPPVAGPRPCATLRQSGDVVFVMAGDDIVAHGLERLFVGLGKLAEGPRDRCRVVACGRLDRKFLAAADVLGLRERLVVDATADPRRALQDADVFVDLSYAPRSNPWIYDALAAGVAVITQEEIAEARLVCDGRAGVVLPAPFRQADFNSVLADAVASRRQRRTWHGGAVAVATDDWFGQAERIADRIARLSAPQRLKPSA